MTARAMTGAVTGALMGALRAELRKTFSTRLWWALGIPVLVLAVLYNLFGALFAGVADAAPGGWAGTVLPLISLAYTMVLTSVFAAVAGVVGVTGEYRHHTASTTYLLVPARGRVLLAKIALGGLLGVSYAAAAAAVGVPAGVLGAGRLADPVVLLGLVAVGALVGALWAALGTAVGAVLGHQVGALLAVLVYLLLADRVLALLLGSSDERVVAALAGFLPGKAADVAVYGFVADQLTLPGLGGRLVEEIASVPYPLPWWGALLVLVGWTAAAGALAWAMDTRRDIT
jgi:ABC-2 type transport system permease protein